MWKKSFRKMYVIEINPNSKLNIIVYVNSI